MTMNPAPDKNRICIAEIVGVHGVRGMLKIKLYSDDPDNIFDYNPLADITGKTTFTLTALHRHGTIFLCEIDGITDRTAAEKLRGTKLFVSRDKLPALDDDTAYYHQDLIGLEARDTQDATLGRIIAVANFGAGDLLDVKPDKGHSFYVPFTKNIVPHVDIANGKIIIDPPAGLIDPPKPKKEKPAKRGTDNE